MAKRAGLTKFYQSYFRAGSDRTHGHHSQLERFFYVDDQKAFQGFVVNPIPRDLHYTCYSLSIILEGLIRIMQRHGWIFDQVRFDTIVTRLSVACSPKVDPGAMRDRRRDSAAELSP